MGEIKLKPCPFCGGEADYILPIHWIIQCKGCLVETAGFDTVEEAAEAWNTRKPMERIVGQLGEEKSYSCSPQYNKAIDRAIKIVKRGGVDG